MIRFLRKLAKRLLARDHDSPALLKNLPPEVADLITRVKREKLTFLTNRKLARLARLCEIARLADSTGMFLEAGCALGGSAVLLASRKPGRSGLKVYDVFATIPEPSERDGADVHRRFEEIKQGKATGHGGDVYYGYQENLYERVCSTFSKYGIPPNANGVDLIKGPVEETLQGDDPVFLAHIDVDWYDPVMVCLERIVPRLSDDGFVVLDDYHDWSGCRRATNDFFKNTRSQYVFDSSAGNLVVAKKGNKWLRNPAYAL